MIGVLAKDARGSIVRRKSFLRKGMSRNSCAEAMLRRRGRLSTAPGTSQNRPKSSQHPPRPRSGPIQDGSRTDPEPFVSPAAIRRFADLGNASRKEHKEHEDRSIDGQDLFHLSVPYLSVASSNLRSLASKIPHPSSLIPFVLLVALAVVPGMARDLNTLPEFALSCRFWPGTQRNRHGFAPGPLKRTRRFRPRYCTLAEFVRFCPHIKHFLAPRYSLCGQAGRAQKPSAGSEEH